MRPVGRGAESDRGRDLGRNGAGRAAKKSGTIAAWSVVGGLLLVVIVLSAVIRAKAKRIAAEREEGRGGPKAPVSVTVRRIEPRTVVDRLRLPGLATAWDDVWVSARVNGQVVAVPVNEGDEVSEGSVICRLDDSDYRLAVENARAALSRAGAAHDLARSSLARLIRLKNDGAVGEAEYDSAEAAERQARFSVEQARIALEKARIDLERTVVRSPMTGTVSKLPVSVGQLLGSNNKVARIVDLTRVRVTVGIPERDVLSVRNLKEAKLTFDAIPGRDFVGKTVQLGVETGERVRVYGLDLEVQNRDRLLRAGMFAKVDVIREVRPDSIVVPFYSVIGEGGDLYCFVVADGVARRRSVQLGIFVGAEVEIKSGLSAGENVVIVGQRQIGDGDPVSASDKLPAGFESILPGVLQ